METPRQIGQKIENILEEIMIEIFKYLPADDIENAVKVCNRWYTIITNSSKLASKPLLVFPFEERTYLQFPENVELMIVEARKRSKEFPFRCIKFRADRNTEIWSNRNLSKIEMFKEILMDHKDHIKELMIGKYEKKFLIHLFNETGINENLTRLELHYDDENGSALAEDVRFDFPNLKHLSVCMGSKFIDLIGSHKIERLEIHINSFNISGLRRGNWQEFFKTCPDLKRLRTFDFFNFDSSSYDFKIESFEINPIQWTIVDEENIKKFLLAQRENLKDLKMSLVSAEVFHVIINNLTVESFKTDQKLTYAAEKVLKMNSSIKRAKFSMVYNSPQSLSFYAKLINCITQVEELSITVVIENYQTIMNFIAASMVKLRNLEIRFMNQSTPESCKVSKSVDLKIEQVEALTISHFPEDFEGSLKLLTSCPNIRNLKIFAASINRDVLKTICSLNNLEQLSIECRRLEFTSEVIDLILTSNIKKITTKGLSLELPEELKRSKIQFDCVKPDLEYFLGW